MKHESWPKTLWELAIWVWFRIPQNIPKRGERGKWRKQLQDLIIQSLKQNSLGSGNISRLCCFHGSISPVKRPCIFLCTRNEFLVCHFPAKSGNDICLENFQRVGVRLKLLETLLWAGRCFWNWFFLIPDQTFEASRGISKKITQFVRFLMACNTEHLGF